MFKTEAIILSIHRIQESNIRVICLTRDYWKVTLWYRKKQLCHDIWDIIFLTIDRQGILNIAKYTESVMSPRENSWSYKKIIIFLENIQLMNLLLPDESPYTRLFQDYKWLLIHMQKVGSLQEHHYLLFQFRILRTLWYIWIDGYKENPVILYIYNNILSTPLSNLLTSKQLKQEDASIIEIWNKEAIHRSLIY